MEDDERMAKVIAALVEQRNTVMALTNEVLSLRAMTLALMDQPGIDVNRLAEDFDVYWLQLVEQFPPNLQHRERLEDFQHALARLRSRQRR
jgi:hypothetical protein